MAPFRRASRRSARWAGLSSGGASTASAAMAAIRYPLILGLTAKYATSASRLSVM